MNNKQQMQETAANYVKEWNANTGAKKFGKMNDSYDDRFTSMIDRKPDTGFSTGDAWECTPFGCADVGAGFGSYVTQLDCESDPTTGCYIMTSIKEIQSANILSPTYDVFGREVKKLQKNTMYIRNNKKFIKF